MTIVEEPRLAGGSPPGTEPGEYVAHAKRFGSEGVYEEAYRQLLSRQLPELIRALRSADPEWKLSKTGRRDVARRLLDEGISVTEVSSLTGLGKTRIYELKEEVRHSTR